MRLWIYAAFRAEEIETEISLYVLSGIYFRDIKYLSRTVAFP